VNWHLFAGFLVITIILILAPGPIVTLVISTGATRGVRAGLLTVAGTSTGNALLLASIALGLNWVLSHAVYLFEMLRWIGAAYLIWLGVQAWRNSGRSDPIPSGNHVHFWRGFLVALSNPKTIAFFTAFLPQFVDPTRPAAHQIAVMCVVSALLAGMLGDRLGVGASLVHETRASQVTRACVRAHIDWWWDVAGAGAATSLRGGRTRPRLSSPMPAVVHHGGDTALRKVCLPASDIGRSPCEPRIIAQDRTVESHAGISKWRGFRLHIRLANGRPREDLNKIELHLRVGGHTRYQELWRALLCLLDFPAYICSVTLI
jgi:homoserine/homoserine lactone efflux protein